MPSLPLITKSSTVWLVLIVAAVATTLYAATLMTTISGCDHPYCADVGEFQVALPLWGTVHYTGYPLYMLLGSPFVAILRVLGIEPATGASLYSLFWEIVAISGLILIVRRLKATILLAGGIGLLFAVIGPIWVHGVIAEVYSLSMALSVAMLYLTLKLHQEWSDKWGWVFAFLGGLSVAHHRLLALLLIPMGLYLLPTILRSRTWPRWFVVAIACFGAGFLPYLDIPLRIWLGSTWNYDQANTWTGFWRIFRGDEVAGLQQPNFNPTALWSALRDISHVLVTELTWLGVVLIGLAAVHGAWVRPTRSVTWLMVGISASTVLFAMVFRQAVLLQATLMTALLGFCLLLAIGTNSLRKPWPDVVGLLCLGLAAWLTFNNWPIVTTLTRAPNGVIYANTVEKLDAPPESLIMAPWGATYFALAYAQRVEGRMSEWQIVDHRADFGHLTAHNSQTVYTHASTLYVFGVDWWAENIGYPLRIHSAGPEMLKLTAAPQKSLSSTAVSFGDGIVLDHWEVRWLSSDTLQVILHWGSTHTPTADYSTFVHLSDQEFITKPEDILAQSDHSVPVYGWYPTSRWVPNEIIREDHLLQFPTERLPQSMTIGMYRQDASGGFVQLGQIRLRQQQNSWDLIR